MNKKYLVIILLRIKNIFYSRFYNSNINFTMPHTLSTLQPSSGLTATSSNISRNSVSHCCIFCFNGLLRVLEISFSLK